MAWHACHVHLHRTSVEPRQRPIQCQYGHDLCSGTILIPHGFSGVWEMRPLSILLLLFSLLFPDDLRAGSNSSETRGNTSPLQGSAPHPSYRLGANDVIKVQVYGEDALTTETRVGGDGRISVPLLGVLEVKGLTVKETAELNTKRVGDGFLKNPRVVIYITKYRNFFVSGEVKNPGGYAYEEGLTVLKAVTLAGGVTNRASEGRIKIKRLKGKTEGTISAKLDDLILAEDGNVGPERFLLSPISAFQTCSLLDPRYS